MGVVNKLSIANDFMDDKLSKYHPSRLGAKLATRLVDKDRLIKNVSYTKARKDRRDKEGTPWYLSKGYTKYRLKDLESEVERRKDKAKSSIRRNKMDEEEKVNRHNIAKEYSRKLQGVK